MTQENPRGPLTHGVRAARAGCREGVRFAWVSPLLADRESAEIGGILRERATLASWAAGALSFYLGILGGFGARTLKILPAVPAEGVRW